MRHWLPVLLWALLMFIGSSIPGHQIPGPVSIASGVLHVIEYAVFGFLIACSLIAQNPAMPRRRMLTVSVIIAVLYSMTDEIHQAYVPGRQTDVLDVIVDAIGGLVGVGVWFVWKKRKNIV